MTKVLDDEAGALAFREAGEAVRSGDPDTLAGRFLPKPLQAGVGSSADETRASNVAPRRKHPA